MIKSIYFCMKNFLYMKQFVLFLSLTLALGACNNGNKAETTDSSSVISTDQINNPATADQPVVDPSKLAVMKFNKTEHHFGDIVENQSVETVYEFVNEGKVDLLISKCEAQCGCTVPNWPRQPIKPGEKGEIKVVFNSAGKSGTNNKIVTVFANIEGGKTELRFTANVRAINPGNNN